MNACNDERQVDAPADEEPVRDKLIVQYLPLVKYVLGRISIYLPQHLDQDDLVEAGIIGLIDAAEKFDRTRQVKFKTYAIPRIRGAILDELRAQDWIPRSARKKASLLQDAYSALHDRFDRAPTVDEIAEELGLSVEETTKMLGDVSFASLLSLETTNAGGGEGGGTIGDTVESRQSVDPADAYALEEQKRSLTEAISRLPEQQRLVVSLYYFEDLLLKEIGEIMDLSESRISQLHSEAVFVLRAKMKRAKAPSI